MNITSISHKMQTAADHCLHHANENVTTIIPLFCNTKNNGLQSAFCSVQILHLSRTVQISSMPIPSSQELFWHFWQDGCTCVCVEELGERRRAWGINKRLRVVWKQGKLACAVCLKPRASKRLQFQTCTSLSWTLCCRFVDQKASLMAKS